MDSLEQVISNYRPSQSAVELVKHAQIVLLAGISGAGKDTIKWQLLETSQYHDIVSHTTRLPRLDDNSPEVSGVDYHFVDQAIAMDMINKQQFIEAKLVHGTIIYGTSMSEVELALEANKIAICDVDVQGVEEYKKMSSGIVAIFILPPSYEVWMERLKKRYSVQAEFDAAWPKRRDSAIKELTRALQAKYYHFVINDDLQTAVREVDEIAHGKSESSKNDIEARQLAGRILEKIESS